MIWAICMFWLICVATFIGFLFGRDDYKREVEKEFNMFRDTIARQQQELVRLDRANELLKQVCQQELDRVVRLSTENNGLNAKLAPFQRIRGPKGRFVRGK